MNSREDDAVAAFQRGDLDQARNLAEQQLSANPASPRLQHLMGLILCRKGALEDGIEWLRKACDSEPENVGYRVMLARALVDCGRPQEALEVAQPPPGNSPAELALWHARAEAANAVEAWPVAAEAWGMMCSTGVGDWKAWNSLGDALGELGRWPEAIAAFERALALNPSELALRRNLAGALNNGGRLEDSVVELRRCIDAVPNDRFLRISLAAVLADLNHNRESDAELEKAAELAGESVRESGEALIRIVMGSRGIVDVAALRELADLLERTNRTEALNRLIDDARGLGVAPEGIGYPAAAAAHRQGKAQESKRLLLTENPDPSPLRWHWLMARIEDSMGNTEAAFAEAGAMNRAFPNYEEWRRRSGEQRRSVRELAGAITPSQMAQLKPLEASERGTPAFVVGFPRSGTTLLDTFLRGHPATEVLEEFPLVAAAKEALRHTTDLAQWSNAELVRAQGAYFAEMDRHLTQPAPRLIVDKLPLNMLAAPVIYALFPKAPMIFAQRHPCDAVLSCFMQAFALNDSMAPFLDIQDAADFYDAAMTVWTRSREALPLKVHIVVYEELVRDPEATLRPAIEFLGLDWRPELLDHRATAKARGAISTPSYDQVVQPLNDRPVGRWRRYEKQLEPVLPVLLPWAKRLGYDD